MYVTLYLLYVIVFLPGDIINRLSYSFKKKFEILWIGDTIWIDKQITLGNLKMSGIENISYDSYYSN